MRDRDWFAKRSGQNGRQKCQTKARSYTCRPIQTNLDSDKKTDNFRKFRKIRQKTKSDKFRQNSDKFRQIQTEIQTKSDKFRILVRILVRQIQNLSEKWSENCLILSEFWSEFSEFV